MVEIGEQFKHDQLGMGQSFLISFHHLAFRIPKLDLFPTIRSHQYKRGFMVDIRRSIIVIHLSIVNEVIYWALGIDMPIGMLKHQQTIQRKGPIW